VVTLAFALDIQDKLKLRSKGMTVPRLGIFVNVRLGTFQPVPMQFSSPNGVALIPTTRSPPPSPRLSSR